MAYAARGFTASIALLLLSTPAFPAESLCGSSEEIVFSCQLQNGKSVSVCASSRAPTSPAIAYRFGSSEKLELEIVAEMSRKSPPVEYNALNGARGYDHFVRFASGAFTYAVVERWDGCPMPGQTRCSKNSFFDGVVVTKATKLIARYSCKRISIGFQGEVLAQLGVPVSETWPE
jgi:hypothetical protein